MTLLYQLELWVILPGLVALLLAAVEAGYRSGVRRTQLAEGARAQVGAIQASVLGLLALLLGFSFAMAASRYDSRRQLVLEEANAIGTASLRARLLPDPYGPEIARLLRHYVDVRLELASPTTPVARQQELLRATGRVHEQIWEQATAASAIEPRLTNALVLQSLNEVIDLHEERVVAFESRVPEIIVLLLIEVAALAVGLTGYGCGLSGHRNFLSNFIMSLLIASVIVVVLDLDRPGRGLIRVSQQSMMRLRESLNPQVPAGTTR